MKMNPRSASFRGGGICWPIHSRNPEEGDQWLLAKVAGGLLILAGVLVMILWLAPIGAFGAIANVVGQTGWAAVGQLMALMLGCLEYVLEEGPNHDWLADEAVFACAVVCLTAGPAFFWRAFTARSGLLS